MMSSIPAVSPVPRLRTARETSMLANACDRLDQPRRVLDVHHQPREAPFSGRGRRSRTPAQRHAGLEHRRELAREEGDVLRCSCRRRTSGGDDADALAPQVGRTTCRRGFHFAAYVGCCGRSLPKCTCILDVLAGNASLLVVAVAMVPSVALRDPKRRSRALLVLDFLERGFPLLDLEQAGLA